ncbi:MAG: hypothetical protein NUV97_00575, partial [archaeon]|nr:hypothetical protein [archaeon]
AIVGKIMGKKLLVMAPKLKERFLKANLNYCGVSNKQFYPLKKKRIGIGWTEKGTELIKKETVEKIARKLKKPLLIAKSIRPEEMNNFYNQCEVYLSFPPTIAGFQASWLEAMMAGVPKVLGNENGSGKIQPFEKIPLGKENDVEFLVKRIKEMKKVNYIEWLGKNDFSWKRHSKKLIEIFSKKQN